MEKLADFDSTFRNQSYKLKLEMQVKFLKPTSIAFIKIETFDQGTSGQAQIVGFSYFPLFIDTRDSMPAKVDTATTITPHLGAYQMNLFGEKIMETEPFGYERFVYKDKVPTASLLIRLTTDKNTLATDKLPYYDEGVYSTIYYMLTEEEKAVMKLRRKQFTAPIRMTMEIFLRHYGLDP